jgi:hypothetical protein
MGRFDLNQCPQSFIEDYEYLYVFSGAMEEGHLPVSGGIADQSAWFINADRRLRAEKDRMIKKERLDVK